MATGGRPAVRVTGAAELRRALGHLGASAADLTSVNRAAAAVVAREAKVLVPKLSGALGSSIRARATKTRGRVSAGGGRLVPYAGPIHFGWPARNIAPQPFLYDALDNRRTEVIGRYDEAIGDLIHRLDVETPG